MLSDVDAVVVGSGPNGLAAAVTLARAGWSVQVFEAADTAGGGLRTEAVLGPDTRTVHDICSATHPLAMVSRFFTAWGLTSRVDMIQPEVPFAHALDGGRFAVALPGLQATAQRLDERAPGDGAAYARLLGPLVERSHELGELFTSRLRGVPPRGDAWRLVADLATRLPRRLGGMARGFSGVEASALLAGNAAHAVRPIAGLAPAAVALLLTALAHGPGGWPLPRGGSRAIAGALLADLVAHGGRVETGRRVRSLGDLPAARAVLLDLDPRQVASVAGPAMTGPRAGWYWTRASRYAFGAGACTVHYATDGPIPWLDATARRAGTVHVGGPAAEVAAAESAVATRRHARFPFVLVGQPSVVDRTRAPAGQHVVWAYCHVPPGSAVDAEAAVTAQIERFAPGFRDTVLARTSRTAARLALDNPVHVGGDIAVGRSDVAGVLLRPVPAWNAYRTPAPGVYVCSAAAPPGPGVHGMGGYWAARTVLRDAGTAFDDEALAG